MKRIATILACLLVIFSVAHAQWAGFQPGMGSNTSTIQGSGTGTVSTVTAVLSGTTGRFTYICGWVITSAGTTTPIAVNATVSGPQTTMNHTYAFVSSGQGVLGVSYNSCIPASTLGGSITVTLPGGGTGTTAAVSAWGYTN